MNLPLVNIVLSVRKIDLNSFWRSCSSAKRQLSPRMLEFKKKLRAKAPELKLDQKLGQNETSTSSYAFAPWPNGVNPHTGEIGGPTGPEPTRYGDWERKGRVSDF